MLRFLLLIIAVLTTLSVLSLTAPPVSADSHTETVNLGVDGMV